MNISIQRSIEAHRLNKILRQTYKRENKVRVNSFLTRAQFLIHAGSLVRTDTAVPHLVRVEVSKLEENRLLSTHRVLSVFCISHIVNPVLRSAVYSVTADFGPVKYSSTMVWIGGK